MVDSRILLAACLLLIAFSSNLHAHGGALDDYGCHRDNSKGNYHCHKGKYKGVEFASKQAMLEQIERDKLNAFNVRLRDARKLYDRELISDDEYAKKKADILEEFVALSAPMEERLKLLKRLHEEKLILDDEYQRAREAILEGL